MSDVGKWDFSFKDLARRKFQTALTMVSLAICVSVTVFLVLFGENLGIQLSSVAEGGLTVGFSGIFSKFILIVVLFNSVAGVMVAYFLMTISTSDRVRDIGIMKAVGCLTDVVFSYFATELLIIVFAGCLLGTAFGILLNLASISLLNFLGFGISMKPINPWLLILIVFSFAFVFYILGMRRIVKATRIEPVKALSSLFTMKTTYRSAFQLPIYFGKSFLAKVASRDLGRRRSMTLQSVACLSVIMVLITLSVVGGVVANETMQSYVERAVGKDVVLVAEAEMAEHYESLLYKFLGTGLTEQINYLDKKYVIPTSTISKMATIEGVVKVAPCLVLEATIYEYPYIQPNPDEIGQYTVIGDERSSGALVVGVQVDNIVNDWLVLGEKLSEANSSSALVSDTLALTLFQDPWLESFKTFDSEFKVVGLCLDPLNNGLVVYVSFDRLSSLVGHAGYNILLLQVNGSDSLSRSKVLSEIEAAISGTGLTVFDLNIILERQMVFLNNLWSLLLSLSMFCFVNAISCLTGYLMLSISGQQRDLGIMRALGAKPETVVKLILLETILLILASGLIGLPIGTAIVFWFFIPEAVFSQKAVLTIAGLLAVLMGVLCLSSLYPSRKIAKTPMIKAMSQA